jgi:hypothetical protein
MNEAVVSCREQDDGRLYRTGIRNNETSGVHSVQILRGGGEDMRAKQRAIKKDCMVVVLRYCSALFLLSLQESHPLLGIIHHSYFTRLLLLLLVL